MSYAVSKGMINIKYTVYRPLPLKADQTKIHKHDKNDFGFGPSPKTSSATAEIDNKPHCLLSMSTHLYVLM